MITELISNKSLAMAPRRKASSVPEGEYHMPSNGGE